MSIETLAIDWRRAERAYYAAKQAGQCTETEDAQYESFPDIMSRETAPAIGPCREEYTDPGDEEEWCAACIAWPAREAASRERRRTVVRLRRALDRAIDAAGP